MKQTCYVLLYRCYRGDIKEEAQAATVGCPDSPSLRLRRRVVDADKIQGHGAVRNAIALCGKNILFFMGGSDIITSGKPDILV